MPFSEVRAVMPPRIFFAIKDPTDQRVNLTGGVTTSNDR